MSRFSEKHLRQNLSWQQWQNQDSSCHTGCPHLQVMKINSLIGSRWELTDWLIMGIIVSMILKKCQEKSPRETVVFAGVDDGLAYARIVLHDQLSDIPSVANKHTVAFNRLTGKRRIIHNREAKDHLSTIGQSIQMAFLKKYRLIPAFRPEDWTFVFITLSSRNSRRDPDNCSKGLVDFGLVWSGLMKNDKHCIVMACPYHLFKAPQDETSIYVCKLPFVLPKITELRALLGSGATFLGGE